jgi:glutamate racemase
MQIPQTSRPLTIGLFDSGIGGLSLLNPLLNAVPARYLYFADTAFLPYGNKTVEQLQERCNHITAFLIEQGADIIISACNTLSTCAVPALSTELAIPLISSAQLIVDAFKHEAMMQSIGIIGTEATIRSQYFPHQLQALIPSAHIIERKCPLLASWIEEQRDEAAIAELVSLYLHPLKQAHIEALIIGCTHYAHIRSIIKKYMGNQVRLISAEQYIVKAVQSYSTSAEYTAEKRVMFFNSIFEQSSAERFLAYLPAIQEYQYAFRAIPAYLPLV